MSSRKTRFAWGPVVAVLILIVATGAITWLHARNQTPATRPFDLIDSKSGREVSDRNFRGKWLLVFFGYTHCPDICPTTLGEIAETLIKLGPLADRLQPIFITLDPKRDTQKVIADYTAAVDPRILGLTGAPDKIADAATAYGVSYAERQLGGDYFLDHSATIYVTRPDGTPARSFLGTADSTAMGKRLRALLQ